MSAFDWRSVYPGTVQVTMVLDPFEAAELLDQAAAERRIIASNTVRGMPAIVFGPEIEPAEETDDEEAQEAGQEHPPQADPDEQAEATAAGDGPEDGTGSAVQPASLLGSDGGAGGRGFNGDPKIAILPVVRREPIADTPADRGDDHDDTPRFDARSPLAGKPPRRAEPPREPDYRYFTGKGRVKRGEITADDQKLIEEAVAAGRVTKCPPFKHALDANDPSLNDWKGKKARARCRGSKNSTKRCTRKAKPQ